MQHLAVFILFHTGLLYMFRVLFEPIIRSSKNCMRNHWYEWYQWLRIQFLDLLMMGSKSTRNM
jgi:hypothetical protein